MSNLFNLTKKQGLFLLTILILMSAFFFLFRLGHYAFLDYDGASYAQIARESIEAKNYLSFTNFENNYFEKPPLYFWLMFLSAKIFGISELAFRLPAALFGIGAIFLVWAFAYYLSRDYLTSFLAGIILLSLGEFVFAGRQVRFDVPLATAILASVYCFMRGLKNKKWYLGFGLSVAVGVLFKNIIGLFAFPLILITSLICRRWSWLKNAYFWLGVILASALIAPWHIYESIKFGRRFWEDYLGHQVIDRFQEEIIGHGITVFHYLKYLFYLTEPWFLVFLILAVWQLYKHRLNFFQSNKKLAFSFSAVLFIFTIFSLARSKLFYYLEPMYPFAALFIALGINILWQELKSESKRKTLTTIIIILIGGGLFNASWQVFSLRSGFSDEYQVAEEEKTAGLYIQKNSNEEKIYSLGWLWLETITYYSRKKTNVLTNENILPESFYLVASTDILKYYKPSREFRDRASLVFKGDNISLYKMSANSSPLSGQWLESKTP